MSLNGIVLSNALAVEFIMLAQAAICAVLCGRFAPRYPARARYFRTLYIISSALAVASLLFTYFGTSFLKYGLKMDTTDLYVAQMIEYDLRFALGLILTVYFFKGIFADQDDRKSGMPSTGVTSPYPRSDDDAAHPMQGLVTGSKLRA